MFLRLTQKFKMAAKSGGKTILVKSRQYTLLIPCMSKILSKSTRFRNKGIFALNAEIQDGRQKWRENDFAKSRQYTLLIPCMSRIWSKSLRFRNKGIFTLNAEIQDGRQKCQEKGFLREVASRLCRYPAGQKFCQNRSISLCFRDKHVFALNAEIQDGHHINNPINMQCGNMILLYLRKVHTKFEKKIGAVVSEKRLEKLLTMPMTTPTHANSLWPMASKLKIMLKMQYTYIQHYLYKD